MNPRSRLQLANGVYHVTNRGVDRRAIVTDDQDRQKWLYCLGDAAIRYGWRVYAYACEWSNSQRFVNSSSPRGNDLRSGRVRCQGRLHNGESQRRGSVLQISCFAAGGVCSAGEVRTPRRMKFERQTPLQGFCPSAVYDRVPGV
ncbi:MAG: hypothetical protein NTY19_43575 [Planctomycetota bacterium]|nr:hypothetical protein [Planctomycetota bacterium]